MTLEITDIQRCCTHDGPGLRTTVFFKGCPLHCLWCHNPETQEAGKELFFRPEKCIGCFQCVAACPQGCHREQEGMHLFEPGACLRCMACAESCPAGALESASRTMEVDEVLELVCQDRVFYRSRGGLTVSGGEPTFQPEGLLALLEGAKKENIHTCLETCGAFPKNLIGRLLAWVDLFLFDIKDTDEARHRANTGASLSHITENLLAIDEAGGESVMRCVLIPEINLNEEHARKLAALFQKLRHCRYIELLPYHPYGLSKSAQLGKDGVRYRQPEKEELEEFAGHLKREGVNVKLYGSLL